ncbi:DUF6514 family protein [Intestinibacillus massiliensis]|nr:DUF6514 family protein [Intestinibacillus massiliensis]
MYSLFEENNQFGVQGGGACVKDITTERAEAERLAGLLNRNRVSLCHLYDVIEDFWGMDMPAQAG